ncbi:hypothetical protein [Citrobacter koseri]|uniref:hypothetical protein n=1 Tax=Citrobacter koseri TaxID=545 RepID=UPI00254BAFCE|nr:hypothetical protein [Citrobacter koseri]MEC5643575.1 hypothetical protein [Citrobacter koseri]WOI93122.1 hypothetical protein R1016_15705 [Citrobacter koseri]
MTTITRELIAAYLNGEVKTLTNSEQKDLARIALAALTAEPAKCGHVNLDCDDGKAVCLSCGKVWEV